MTLAINTLAVAGYVHHMAYWYITCIDCNDHSSVNVFNLVLIYASGYLFYMCSYGMYYDVLLV